MQTTPTQGYELIDFGNGRKLERFGKLVVNRPCPAADGDPELPAAWESAELIYNSRQSGEWQEITHKDQKPNLQDWLCRIDDLTFQLKPSGMGQVGLFPEHWEQWVWLEQQLGSWSINYSGENRQTPKVLHLFAYTGATTLKLASLGAAVTHVDAMESAVLWARSNAKLSGLESSPIRWIVEDARRYVSREIRRNVTYDLIVLDPPSYGHGPSGKAWEIHRDLHPLLADCSKLLSSNPIGVLMTGHSRDIRIRDCWEAIVSSRTERKTCSCESLQAKLNASDGRKLDCGYVARFAFLRS